MTWYDIIATITKLTELDELTVESCASALECKFESAGTNRYRSEALPDPFRYAEFISGSEKSVITLILQAESAIEEYVLRMLSLGKPIDISNASPSTTDETISKNNLDWERKYSLCYEIGDCQVWFGIEVANSRKQLVSVSIHRH